MASTYVNNLRLNEMATGDGSGTWGTTTNTNLELIGQALGYGTRAIANASTDNITIADGASDSDRAMYLKLTGGGQACTVTLLPNTASKVWMMENATSYTLTFTCGSGANVAILAGETKVIATDGAGSGGVVYDVLTDVNLAGTTKTAALTNAGALSNQGTVTVGVDDTGYDVKLFGATSGAYMLWDESADDLKLVGAAGFTVAGDIDIDGTTNLDVVDIDGAVDMSSTLAVEGAVDMASDITFADGADIITASAGTSNFRAGVNAGNSIASGGNYNVAIGDEAGTAITTGDNNVAVGAAALDANTTASNNTAVGYASLGANTTGTRNVALGAQSLEANTTANDNTAVGYQSLEAATTGGENTAMGNYSLKANTTGTNNVAIGDQALEANTTAANNTAVGYQALEANVTGTSNAAVGKSALALNTVNDNTAVGYNAMAANTTGRINTAVGKSSMTANTTGVDNAAFGGLTLDANTTGGSNTALGYATLSGNTTASNNTAVGSLALYANTTGAENTAVGLSALAANTTAASNVAVGFKTLFANTTGAANTGLGESALRANTTASNNTAVGFSAGTAVTTGHSNVAVGASAGDNITTGDNNIIIGYNIDAASATADNQLSIGGWIVGSAGQITMPSQPAFNAYPASIQSNIAINTAVTVVLGTEAFDVGANFASNTFTAPVTGKYQLNVFLQIDALDLDASLYQLQIITSNKSYNLTLSPGSFDADVTYWGITNSVLADMDASDTAVVKIYQAGGAAQADISVDTNFSGYLVC